MNKIIVLSFAICLLSQISFAAPTPINNTVPDNSNAIFLNNVHEVKNVIQSSNQELSDDLMQQNQKMQELQEETQRNLQQEIKDEMPTPRMINIF